jgi:Tfp pilus assembly PilM family ATPase
MVTLLKRSARQSPIGLDIGETGIRAAQLRRCGNGWLVQRTARLDRQRADSDPQKGSDALERAIRTCLRQVQFLGHRVVAALNPPDAEFHTLDLPAAILAQSSANLTQVVQSEVTRLAGKSGEPIETAHWALPPTHMPAPNAIGTAVRRGMVDRLVQACDQAHLECTRIDVNATALCRFGSLLNDWGPDQLWGVLDVGCRQTRLVLCADDVPVLVRAAGTGGQAWTERIAEALEISPKSAEVHKCEHGFTPPGQNAGRRVDDGPGADLGAILYGILRSDLNELVAEIKRSYEYVLSCYPSRRAADLVLVGGGAALKTLPDFLGRALGISVRPASTYAGRDTCRLFRPPNDRTTLEVFALTLGLAIGG